MSEQRISQRSPSDFSIARILSNDLSPNLKKKSKISDEFYFQGQEKVNINKETMTNQNENQRDNDKLNEMERLQPVNVSGKELRDLKESRTSKILGKELPWLRCTRYSPPKLPRRSSGGKMIKRRLGSHPRIPFSKLQIQVLEEKYKISAYLSRRDVIQLAGNLKLPQNRVKIWFQNRRARERRESQSHNLALNS